MRTIRRLKSWVNKYARTLPADWVQTSHEGNYVYYAAPDAVAATPPTIATARALTDDVTAIVNARLKVCQGCDQNKGITDMRPKFATVAVKCAACTKCEGGRSLTALGQACPLKKW